MSEKQRVEYLIVDTSAFIRNAALQDIGINIITEQDVVNEVTNKRQLRRLVVLPYDLEIQNAHPESIKFVTEFAKKTGDYTSLSATDIKVIALTYQLEKEKVGTDHLRTVPLVSKTVDYSALQAEDSRTPLAGFYLPEKKEIINENATEEHDSEELEKENYLHNEDNRKVEVQLKDEVKNSDSEEEKLESCDSDSSNIESDYETADSDIDQERAEDLSSKFSKLTCEPSEFIVLDKNNSERNVDDILAPIENNSDDEEDNTKYNECENYEGDENNDGDDHNDNGWITPKNISIVKKEINSEHLEEKPATVACLTIDFAMQNVLKQIGLNVVALDGRLIKQMKTFIFRCYACYKTTSIMTKVFCPNCGNKTLKKVAVVLDGEGNQQIHINFRKPISKKGKRFSLPMPKGGKHANNPILCEDQPVPHQRQTRLARTKNDPLQDDYIAGYSPFIMRDVYSKSAMLGIRPSGSVKHWMQKNPNECRGKRK